MNDETRALFHLSWHVRDNGVRTACGLRLAHDDPNTSADPARVTCPACDAKRVAAMIPREL
jgi:hypothetical protein